MYDSLKAVKYTASIAALSATMLFGTSALAEDGTMKQRKMLKDDTHVTLSGTVGKIMDGDEFELRHKNGSIKVDTNDRWPNLFSQDASEILKTGDKVRVSGVVDDNLFTKKEIDATRIAHDGMQYYRVYWLDDDARDYDYVYWYDRNRDGEDIVISGTISRVTDDQEFMLNYTGGTIQVDADDISEAKTDWLAVGDQITVFGEIDDDWFEKREIDAERIVRVSYYPPLVSR